MKIPIHVRIRKGYHVLAIVLLLKAKILISLGGFCFRWILVLPNFLYLILNHA